MIAKARKGPIQRSGPRVRRGPRGYTKLREIPAGAHSQFRIWFACPRDREYGYLNEVGYEDHIRKVIGRLKEFWPDVTFEAHEIKYVTVPGGRVLTTNS